MDNKHTPGPWFVRAVFIPSKRAPKTWRLTRDEFKANPDPIGEVPNLADALAEVRKALTEAIELIEDMDEAGQCDGDFYNAAPAVAGIARAALARLTPPARCTSTSTGHGHTGTWTNATHEGCCLTEYTCGGPNG